MIYTVALSIIKNIPIKQINELINQTNDDKLLFTALSSRLGFKKNDVLAKAENIIRKCRKNNIEILQSKDKSYPVELYKCVDRPIVLYKKGNGHINKKKCISIVGTRNNTYYGREITESLIEHLKSYNINIISGLAFGIDIIAHRKALVERMSTFAVLGSGLLHIYPKQHQKELDRMMELGGVISEFPPDMPPLKFHFPKRNRIIAGISSCTLLIESKTKGGGIITAKLASSYNRDVFAVPGNINNPSSAGCNNLIQQHEAIPLTCANQLIQEIKMEKVYINSVSLPKMDQKKTLSENEKIIVDTIMKYQPLHIDVLYQQVKVDFYTLLGLLTKLEMEGIVLKNPGNIYKINTLT